MDSICSRWRKPVGRKSNKRNAASLKAMARWNKEKKCGDSQVSASVLSSNTEESVLCNANTQNTVSVENTSFDNVPIIKNCDMNENKISKTEEKFNYFQNEGDTVEQGPAYTIVHDSAWKELLKNLSCEECGKKELTVNSIGRCGFAAKLQIKCTECNKDYGTSFSSPRLSEQKKFQVNKDVVQAFIDIGKGHAAMEKFSMALGIPALDRKSFDKYVLHLSEENKQLRKKILDAAQEKVKEVHRIFNRDTDNQDILDIAVSYDGTWHKRGYSSLYCIGCVVDILTGLVIDYEVVSKYCHNCCKTAADLGENSPEYAIWFESHKSSGACEKNYEGSSGSMEVHAAQILWKRSVQQNKMRYTTLLSDGDSKTFISLSKEKVYGEQEILKEECINHVAKRLGTALRNKVKEWRTKGVCLGGKKKGNLTEETINKLTNYYRKAIKDNAPDVNQMKTAIFASLYHAISTNLKPQHQKCPSGSESWCFYNRAMALGSEIPDHSKMKTKLSEEVISKILPVYQRLASDEILNRCKSAKTQNSNESVHSLIWKYCPKDTFISKKRVELAAAAAISQFNMGCEASLKMKENENEIISSPGLSIAKRRDERRLKQSVYRSTADYKKAYQNRKFIKNKKNRKQIEKEGISYSAGFF